ncbi:MAG TPA: CHAT domain-containing protein [Thermoanaerobaculia bacterium]|nr:CHAT domain-containing protein [Thermoanaerobaculia bacterium]
MLDLAAIGPFLAVAEGDDEELAVLAFEALAHLPLDAEARQQARVALVRYLGPLWPISHRTRRERLEAVGAELSVPMGLRIAPGRPPSPFGDRETAARLMVAVRRHAPTGRDTHLARLQRLIDELQPGAEVPLAAVVNAASGQVLTRTRGKRPSGGIELAERSRTEAAAASSPPILGHSAGEELVGDPPEDTSGGQGADGARPVPPEQGDDSLGEATAAPRRRWPRLDAPAAVVAEVPFELTVGLAASASPGSAVSEPMALPPGEVEVAVTVMAHGFRVEGSPEVLLRVTEADPFPSRTLRLTALEAAELLAERGVFAVFSVRGEGDDVVRALAHRSVRVVGRPEDLPATAAAAAPPVHPGVDLSLPGREAEADLTLVIARGNDAGGTQLEWAVRAAGLGLPAQPANRDERTGSVGDRPEEFLAGIIRKASETADPHDLYLWLVGRGRRIARAMPRFVRDALVEAVRRRAPEPPTVLLLSAEPHVPWELAVLDELAGDPGAAPFLGARARVGRWLFTAPPPPQDPPRSVTVRRVAAVSGVYDGVPGWQRLPHAEREARQVVERWGPGEELAPEFDQVVACLGGDPPADVLHFALHGRFQGNDLRSGLVLLKAHPTLAGEIEEQILQPDHVVGAEPLRRQPFVFLNACQVGAGERLLGDYGGMAAAFVSAGASAVVAPLWSVNDEAAHAFALGFYEETLGADPASAAEVLRQRRAEITRERARAAPDGSGLLSVLAYQLFGHPAYRLTRATSPRED